jgi:hypothetical protein
VIHKIEIYEDKTPKFNYHVSCSCHVDGRFVAVAAAREYASMHALHQTGINKAEIEDKTLKATAQKAVSSPASAKAPPPPPPPPSKKV